MLRLQTSIVLVCAAIAIGHPARGESPLVGPFDRDGYPQAVIDRPLTLPAGMVEGEIGGTYAFRRTKPDAGYAYRHFFDAPMEDWGADVALRAGITDWAQIEAGTSFSIEHRIYQLNTCSYCRGPVDDVRPSLTSWKRVVPLRLSLLALDTEAVDTAVTVTLPFVGYAARTFDFGRFRYQTRNTDGRVLPEVDFAAPTRWRLTDWLWLRAGEDLFRFDTQNDLANVNFVFGVGLQPHRLFAVTVDSRFASVFFDGGGHSSSVTIADFATLALGGTFAPTRWFDVVGSLDVPRLGQGFDTYRTRLALRLRF